MSILKIISKVIRKTYFLSIREVLKLDLALQRLKETSTFHGNGYFIVDKTTLTAMLSTTVTYLIVLLQTQPTPDGGVGSNATSNCSCLSG